ncbi:hypothetical protein [Delftia acidovorans]|jgi:hypothetical protein|uniref:hypothetical protein n=1 Tax=Delftia acidovorans TaxID=80866 RepID=UPI000BDBDE08|nr:hypothetical protein [Delftia acidovorans]MCG3783355.1 hypothetical protein [Delftia acidovorans]SOE35903.1 hypothetical protein SAMN05216519_1896 [Delftia acidovorans]
MKVKVTILREAGARSYHRGPLQYVKGELDLLHAPVPGEKRTVPVLRILGDDGKNQLFEPRLIYACAGKMKFSGLEHCDRAWHAQEWSCEFDY